MQNGMSDGLLFYLAGFSSVEMGCVFLHVHVCVLDKWESFYVPSIFRLVPHIWKHLTDADAAKIT